MASLQANGLNTVMTHTIQFVSISADDRARFIKWCATVCFHKWTVEEVGTETHFKFWDRMDADRFVLCHRDYLEAL